METIPMNRKARRHPIKDYFKYVIHQPCILYWSDGSRTDTTLFQSFISKKNLDTYIELKESGKAYPVKVYPKNLLADKELQRMCKDYTKELVAVLEGGKE